MEIMEILFIYLFPSTAVILAIMLGIFWIMLPRTGKYMLKKKLGMMQGKTLNMVAYDDRYMSTEAMFVAPEGMLETRPKRGMSKSFYLAKPRTESNNQDENQLTSVRDMDICPPYYLDGIPFYFSHIAKAFATNPRVLSSLRAASRLTELESKKGKFKAQAVTPQIMVDVIDPESGEKIQMPRNLMEVEVKLPFDPVDIKKNIGGYIQQSNIDSTKRRLKEQGKEEVKRERSDIMKYVLILGVVGMVICGIIVFGGNAIMGGG